MEKSLCAEQNFAYLQKKCRVGRNILTKSKIPDYFLVAISSKTVFPSATLPPLKYFWSFTTASSQMFIRAYNISQFAYFEENASIVLNERMFLRKSKMRQLRALRYHTTDYKDASTDLYLTLFVGLAHPAPDTCSLYLCRQFKIICISVHFASINKPYLCFFDDLNTSQTFMVEIFRNPTSANRKNSFFPMGYEIQINLLFV